jgi:peptidyl-tRNA hydrolase
MANVWLNCVVRKDLQLPEVLLAAQVAHISDQWMRERIIAGEPFTEPEQAWMKEPYINILAVNTYEELKDIYASAVSAGLKPVNWTDILPSEALKKNLPDIWVGLSIGPADMDKLRAVTGNLPRY